MNDIFRQEEENNADIFGYQPIIKKSNPANMPKYQNLASLFGAKKHPKITNEKPMPYVNNENETPNLKRTGSNTSHLSPKTRSLIENFPDFILNFRSNSKDNYANKLITDNIPLITSKNNIDIVLI